MKTLTLLKHSTNRTLIASTLLILGSMVPVVTTAQTYVDFGLPLIVDAIPAQDPAANGIRITVPVTSSPIGPGWDTDNTLAWYLVPPGDVVWNSGFNSDLIWQYLRFQSADTDVRNVFWSTTTGGDFTTQYSPKIGIEHLHLENVNIDPSTVQLAFEGSNTFSWTMSNARYATSIRTPTFKAIAPLEMSAVAGTSSLAFWNGEIGSPTKLVVAPGATLVFERVGDIGKLDEIDRQLVFSQQDANTADVNGGTLQLDFSGVVFDSAPEAAVVGGEVTAGLVVRNGGTLQLSGFDGDVASTRLEMRGGMLVDNGTISLGARTTIEFNAPGEEENLVLNNATVSLEEDAALKADFTTFGGTSTVTTATAQLGSGSGFLSPVAFQDAATVLNVEGTGNLIAEDLVSLNGGTLNLDMTPNTGRLIASGPFTGAGTVHVASGNVLEIKNTFAQSTFGTIVINEGTIVVGDGGNLAGEGTIAESGGLISVLNGGQLNGNTLPTGSPNLAMGALTLEFDSSLLVGIDPSAGQASLISVDQLRLDRPASSLAPFLTIRVGNDAALAAGEKFALVDYSSIFNPTSFEPEFRGIPDGHIFQLGLNTYQIRYEDTEYSATNSSVITLTVVESPYETWINGYPGIPIEKRGPTDDADGDGYANVFEFAHNGDPTDPSVKGLLAWLLQDAGEPVGQEFILVVAMRNGANFSAGPSGGWFASVDGITSTVEGSLDLLVGFPSSPVTHVEGPSGNAPVETGLPDLTSAAWKYHTFKLDAWHGLPSFDRGFMSIKSAINVAP